jgi:protein O-mannosyl-transferase
MSSKEISVSTKKIMIVYIFLTVFTLAAFWQVTGFDFFNFDDDVYVTKNIHTQSGVTLDGLCRAFSSPYAEFWHPLTLISFMFDYQLYGLNPGGYHLTNLLLHLLSTLLLFWLFNRMTGALWKSAFVAALFAFHPLHVESVAWVAKRKDVLSTFFWMITLCIYVYYTEKPAIKKYILMFFFFLLALMSKPWVITLPLIMILLDYWPLNRFILTNKNSKFIIRQLKEKVPFVIVSFIFSVITYFVHGQPYHVHFSLMSRLKNASISLATYPKNIFWPLDLSVFYPFSDKISPWQVLGSALFLVMITSFVIKMVKRLPYLFVGWFWYIITLLPVLGVIQVNTKALSDNYTYLPLIGIAIMLAWGIPFLFYQKYILKKVLFPLSVIILLVCAALAWQQCHYWRNSITLYSHALSATKDKVLVYLNRGIAYAQMGYYQPAIEDFNQAIALRPDDALVYFNRGITYTQWGKYPFAIKDFNQVIALKPDSSSAYFNRGVVYATLKQYQKAIEDFKKAAFLKRDYADAYFNSGHAYFKLKKYKEAIEEYNKAINLKPEDSHSYINRGLAYFMQGNYKDGCRDAQKVCELDNCNFLQFATNKGYCL